jgi:hypothetical protein
LAIPTDTEGHHYQFAADGIPAIGTAIGCGIIAIAANLPRYRGDIFAEIFPHECTNHADKDFPFLDDVERNHMRREL